MKTLKTIISVPFILLLYGVLIPLIKLPFKIVEITCKVIITILSILKESMIDINKNIEKGVKKWEKV